MVDRIGRYTIVAELGRGGMGVVYKAHEESLNRFVALKVLGEHLTEDPAHVERFLREAQSAARLNHPNIVQIYAIGEDAGRHFFVMEHVTGQSLQKILRARGPLDSIQTARIALQAASGLHAAHQHGIIHRDIKPANLLIDNRGLLKIADFGLALMGGAASRLTATGMFMGTPGYLSPEQCLDQNIDHRTDIYSLGVTLFETLSGKAPFRGDSPLALLRQIIEVEPPDLGELAPGVDPELRALVARMMAKNRERRMASCAEIIMAIEAQLAARGVTGSLLERLSFTTGGGPPQSPASAEDLESRPTTAVSGDLPKPPAPTVTALASPPAPPLIESVPIEPVPRSSSGRLALIAALVVVFGLAAVVLGGVSAWRSGLFSLAGNRVANRAEQPASTSGAAATIVADEAETLPVEEVGTPTSVSTESSTTTARSARETTAAAVNRPTLVPEGRTAGPVSAPPPERVQAGAAVEASGRPPADPPHPPEGTVVIAVGEQLLAGEVEAYIEAALTRAGVPLVDEHGIPGIGSILTGDEGPRPSVARDLLQPHARNLVMVRVEHLGERPLVYMGQRDVAFQARVSVVPIDIASGTPIQQPTRFRIEYTHLNAGRVVEKELRQPTARIVKLLDEY